MRLQKLPAFASEAPIALPIGEWLPDQPAFSNPGSALVSGVVPLTDQSYGPMPSFAAASSGALNLRCQGALPVKTSTGAILLFAGDAASLYDASATLSSFSNLSRTGGYNLANDQFWSFAQYGDRIFAAHVNDNLQSFLVGTDSTFSDVAAAPRGRYAAVLKDFLVLLNTWDAAAGFQPQRAWWSAIGNPLSWPTPGTIAAVEVQSDNQDLYDGGFGGGTGVVGPLGAADGALFFERGIYRMQYVGSPAVWDFQIAQGAKGCRAPASIVPFRNTVYYLSDDGFYAFDGATSRPIGAGKWDRWFLSQLDASNMARVQGVADPINRLIFWSVPTTSSQGNSTILLAYNWQFDRASMIELSSPVEALVPGVGFPSPLDSDPGTLDADPFTLDSAFWAGGSPVLGAFDLTHTLNYALGEALAATVETGERQFFAGRRARVQSVRPMIDGGAPTVSVGTRERTIDALSYGSAVAVNSLGECPQNVEGRYVRAKIALPANSGFSQIAGAEFTAVPRGFR
jgi:hypothetical protein